MIVVDKPEVPETDFLSLLERTKGNCLDQIARDRIATLNSGSWENLVYLNTNRAAEKTPFEGHVRKTGKHSFPDLVAKRYYGIEVKMTEGDKWQTTGNSTLETTREDGVERIYIFFGKFGSGPEIKYRPYQDCLYDIAVTHSPRYLIDMDLPQGQSIFHKMGVDYDELRVDEKRISKIREYFRSQLKEGQDLWFIEKKETVTSPIYGTFRNLNPEIRAKYIVESMILFPEVFGNSKIKYERPALYLMTKYNAICLNLRDHFSAAGQETIVVNRSRHLVPKVFYHLKENAQAIWDNIGELDGEVLAHYWRLTELPADSARERILYWKALLNTSATSTLKGITAFEVFEAGLG